MDLYMQKISDILQNDAFEKQSQGHQAPSEGLIKSVNLMARENAPSHCTDVFKLAVGDMAIPIYRRGQPFTFIIDFSQPFQLAGKKLRLDFNFGPQPLPGNGTQVRLIVSSESAQFQAGPAWGIRIKQQADMQLTLEVKTAPNSPVGIWFMSIVTNPGEPAEKTFHVAKHMYIIFNPFCKEDDVYMENEDMRFEYVMNKQGLVYQGSDRGPLPTLWQFNQFEPVVLTAAVLRLEAMRLELNRLAIGDPVQVTRFLSYGCAYLHGKWDGDYRGGREPTSWSASDAIFKIYMETLKPVKFGQCWVFSAIQCSLCRALGIPCRVVSNFQSGHDKNGDLSVDLYFDVNQQQLPRQHVDSGWNFHVWNDGWMARPDLPSGYGGWQAFDATPQDDSRDESSRNIQICGPASVEAIKKGEIGYRYDTLFIYGEVNADMNTWLQQKDGTFKLFSVNKHCYGAQIMTKAVGRNEGENLGANNVYKYPEGSSEERQVMSHAAKLLGDKANLKEVYVPPPEDDDIFMDMMPIDSVIIGKPLCIFVNLVNNTNTDKARTVQVTIRVDSIEYNGVLKKHLNISGNNDGKEAYTKAIVMEPKQREIVKAEVAPEIYLENLSGMAHMRIYASASVVETNQVWVSTDNVYIRKPNLTIEMPDQLQRGTQFVAKISFTNPLPREMKNCRFSVNANCMPNGHFQNAFRNVQPNEAVSYDIQLRAEYVGQCSVVAQFNSDVLTNVTGSKIARCG